MKKVYKNPMTEAMVVLATRQIMKSSKASADIYGSKPVASGGTSAPKRMYF